MKINNFGLLLSMVLFFGACSTSEFNYSPRINILYSPVRLNNADTLVMTKVDANNISIVPLSIGDTLSVKVHLFDLVYNLKSVSFTTNTNASTTVLLPSDNQFKSYFASSSDFIGANLIYKKKTTSQDINILYMANQSDPNGHLTIVLQTMNPDSTTYMDSLRINTPVK